MPALYDPLNALTPGSGEPHPPSYWTATAGAAPPDDGAVPAAADADVAIIGGGYTGLSCAYHLARDYGIHAMVLEANQAGWGCSGRNGGFARAAIGRHSYAKMIELWGRDTARKIFRESLAALQNVRDLVRDGGIDCNALETGHLKIAHRPGRAPALLREAELLQRDFDYPAEFLDAAELQQTHIGGTQSHGALRFPDAVAVHPLKLAHGMLALARASGATVHSASAVTACTKSGSTHVLTTPGGTVRARTVVMATNGYTPEHLHSCVRGTTLPVLSHIIVTRPMSAAEKNGSGFRTGHVLTDTRNLLYYWRRLPDDRILFGGRGLVTDTLEGRAQQRDFLLAELQAKLPALRDITVDYDWWGWVCLTADFLPHVGCAADDPSVHYALGYQGSGVSYALYAGKLLAQRIAGDGPVHAAHPVMTPLPRFPLAALRRHGQRALYYWYRWRDLSG
ncbi:MAG: FAD-binding oxidoreductase [Burkholderiales bacterium]|jgi:gamma-glutamylputrescine oxidase|nr:FAD-binding oxidoreductase [Burkholderiales bacterium]